MTLTDALAQLKGVNVRADRPTYYEDRVAFAAIVAAARRVAEAPEWLQRLLENPPDEMPCGHEELIEKIRMWSQAYPLDVFPEPDLTDHDPSRCSAAMGRHVIGRLMELIDE